MYVLEGQIEQYIGSLKSSYNLQAISKLRENITI